VKHEDSAVVSLRRAAWLFAACCAAALAIVVFTRSALLIAVVGVGMPLAFMHVLLRATGHNWQEIAVAVQARGQRVWVAIHRR
jgi:hypothetical protein